MKQTDNGEKSKTENRRAEKKDRIKAQKNKKGKKKAIKTSSKLGKVLFPIILVVLILVFISWAAFAAGLPQRLISPIKVGNEKVSSSEYNYFYNAQVNQVARLGVIRPNAVGKYDLTGKSILDPNKTWEEYFREATAETIQEIYLKVDQAKKNNLTLDDREKEQIQSYFTELKKQFPSEAEYTNALLQQFGPGAKPERLIAMFEKVALAQKFSEEHLKGYEVTTDEVNQYYEENKDNLDFVTYYSYMIKPEDLDSDLATKTGEDGKKAELTTEEQEQIKQESKAKADEFLAEVTDEESFAALVESKTTDADKKPDALQTNLKGSIVNQEVANWLFDQARENGDKAVIESNDHYFVVYYVSRDKDEAHLPSVRHILFEADREKATAEEKQEAKKAAEDILAKITDEEQMEVLGDELQSEGKAKESQRYDDVPQGQMVEEFNDWIFNPARKPGDKDIVETQYGYHVMYFVGFSEQPVWASKSDKAIRKQKFEEEMKALKEEDAYKIHISDLGMKLAQKR